MKIYKKIFSVFISSIIAASAFSFHMQAEENYTVSAADPRFKYIMNENGTVSIAANEASSQLSGKISIPSTLDGLTVTGICKNGFSDNEKITSVNIPDTVKEIDSLAFSNCSSLASVTLPDTITSMGSMPFSCSIYEENIIKSADSGFVTINDYILYIYTGNNTDIFIPGGIKVIADSAFANNGYYSSEDFEITSVTIPDTVEYIGNDAFFNCKALSSATILTGVKEIGSNAFTNTSVTIYGYNGTYAQKYSNSNNITFVLLISNPNEFKYEIECDKNYKCYYFSTDTSFSQEGIRVYKRYYDGSRDEVTNWDFTSSPDVLYNKS